MASTPENIEYDENLGMYVDRDNGDVYWDSDGEDKQGNLYGED